MSGLWILNGGTSWATAGAHVRRLWVWSSGAWQPVIKQWVWDGSAWQLGFDGPGPLASITITPDPGSTTTSGSVITFTAHGVDAFGTPVAIPSPSWSISTITDSITPSGSTCDFTPGGTSDSGTITCTSGSISGSASYTVS